MKKTAVLLVILLICALIVPSAGGEENSDFAKTAYSRVSELLSRPGLPVSGAKSMYEGGDSEATSGICFYFDTNRVYIYGENAQGEFEQYLFIGVSDEDMAECVPAVCGEWDTLEPLAGDRPLLITIGINNVYYYAKSKDDANEMTRSFNLLTGRGGYEYVTVRKDANVRELPSLAARRIGYVEAGTTQVSLGTETDRDGNVWYKIEYADGYGYVSASVVITGEGK